LLHSAARWQTLPYVIHCYLCIIIYLFIIQRRTLPHTAAHCRTLLYVIYCYLCIIIYLLFSSAAHCRILPHAAAHCCTLPYVIYCFLFIVIRFIFSAAHWCTLPHAGKLLFSDRNKGMHQVFLKFWLLMNTTLVFEGRTPFRLHNWNPQLWAVFYY